MRSNKWETFGIVMIVIVVLGVLAFGLNKAGILTLGKVSETELSETEYQANVQLANCPDDKDTGAVITLKNEEDDTTDDTFDATGYLYKIVGGAEEYATSITDTTAGAATLDCNVKYRLKIVSANADEGDNSKLSRVVSGAGAIIVDGGKGVDFTPVGSSYALKLAGERHGVLEYKAFDNVENGWMYDNTDGAYSEYEGDGVQFNTTTATDADKTIGATDEFDIDLHFRSTKTNTSFDDYSYYILVEAGTDTATVWQEPVMTLNGQKLTKYSLAGDEARQFQSYDWAFLVEGHDITDSDNVLRIQMRPQTGQNPSTDLQFDFASVGGYLSVDGSTVKYGAAQDNTAASVVFTVMDVTFDIA